MERKCLFAFIYDNKDCLFRDIMEDDSPIEYLPSHKVYANRFMNLIERISLSYQVNSRVNIPFKKAFSNLDNYDYDDNTDYYVIIPNSSIAKFDVKYLKEFKSRHKNIHLIALLVDSMHGSSIQMSLVRSKLTLDVWDCITTYDKYDAEEFGFTWIGYTYYSSYSDVSSNTNKASDLFCVSSPKGRDKMYAKIYNYLTEHGINCNFRLFTHSKEKNLPGTKLEYMHKYMSYDEVVSEIKASNCILEILQPNQKMQTIRYFEAIAYNKKLLTNNPRITELPYYDPRYMKVFDNLGDIDIDWVKTRENIDYKYRDDFSPKKLINIVNSL